MSLGKLGLVNFVHVSSATASVELGGIDKDCPYLLICNNVIPETDPTDFKLRFNESGNPVSSADYDGSRYQLRAGGSYAGTGYTNETFFDLSTGLGNNSREQLNLHCLINSAYDSSNHTSINFQSIEYNSSPELVGYMSSGTYTQNSLVNGVTLLFNGGNIQEGKFALYRVDG